MTETAALPPRPVVLCILDGWGWREDPKDNAIAAAETPNWDRFVRQYPLAFLEASALQVGLPEGQMGNSEVGHMNLGAGRVVMQDLPRIDQAFREGTLGDSPALRKLVDALRQSGGTCHLMGLLSPGGVHSHQDHIAGLARIVAAAGISVKIHAFLDGRDTPPRSAADYMGQFLASLAGTRGVTVATVGGRYYAMDRDKRWERVFKAYACLTQGEGEKAADPATAIQASYLADKGDEFMLPTAIGGYSGMRDGDGLIMANFRADRAREILEALCDPDFSGFSRPKVVRFAARVGMAEYSKDLSRFLDNLFPPGELTRIFGELVSEAGLTQLRIAETEKYAHVTFFFNGGREQVFAGEERILVPSPKVATYDLQPEMSAREVTDRLVEAIASGRFDVVIVNYANGDMVGHTGFLEAAAKAAATLDGCLGRLERAVGEAGGVLLVTADHGNCEQMRDEETGQPHTAHTLNPVPVVLVHGPAWAAGLRNGRLADVAPTLLRLLGLPQPKEMTGRPLIVETGDRQAAAQ
ncbi:MAG: 2,3-bisphosphoglycerate-independent phosphoglycerate mutase [Magnetospirillum sp. WYHS-4]